MKMRRQEGLEIKDVVLRYRSALTYDIPVKYDIKKTEKHYLITAYLNFDEMNLRELYWDLRIIANKYGIENEIRARFTSNYWKNNFYLTNRQYSAGEGHIPLLY